MNPFVLPASFLKEVSALTRAVFRFQKRLPLLLRQDFPGLSRICPLEPRAREWLDVLPARRSEPLLIRLDFGLGEQGPVLFETNATALAGFHYHPAGVRLLKSLILPGFGSDAALSDPPDLSAFLRRWIKRHSGGARRVGFVEDPPFGPGDTEMPEVARVLRRDGLAATWGEPCEIRRGRGGYRLRGKPVDWLYRDIPFKEMGSPSQPNLRDFRALLAEGRSGPGTAAEFDHKGLLECFTSKEFSVLFTRAELREFSRLVPWTRSLYQRRTLGPDGKTMDLPGGLAREPERWALKPDRECGGEGIVLGRESPAAWSRALDRAAREPGAWVVQEWRPTNRRPMLIMRSGRTALADCYAAVGVFCGERERGVYARVSPGPVVNVARGGALAAVFFIQLNSVRGSIKI